VVSGLANEYISYFTTPEEFDAQHYEGGSSLYGRLESLVIQFGLSDLATDLAKGRPAPTPYALDPRNGVTADGAAYSTGATKGSATAQPAAVVRLARASFSWAGGPRGFDRPLDKAFVSVQRRTGGHWRTVTTDLGMQMDWSVDDAGTYTARWEVPLSAPAGAHRFVVTANHYRVVSRPFTVSPSHVVTVTRLAGSGPVRVALSYPPPVTDVDLTSRPTRAYGGRIVYTVGGRRRVARIGPGRAFTLIAAPGAQISIAAGGARDGSGNSNAEGVIITA
jgi:hypothetical protein